MTTAEVGSGSVERSRTLVGVGLNVVARSNPVTGRVKWVGKPADVVRLMRSPDLAETVIMSRGGAVTFAGALLTKGPAGVITIEGAPESHLGILSREFDISAVMSMELEGDVGVARLADNGLVTSAYVQMVVDALDGREVELDCSDPEQGRVYVLDGSEGGRA